MANTALADMTGASALDGTEIVYGNQSSGDVKITTAQVKTLTLGTPTNHGLVVGTATGVAMLVAAAAGTLLQGGGASADPAFTATPTLGIASSVTGQLKLAHASSANLTTLQAGNAAAARTYMWPTNFGSAGGVLTDAGGDGTLSWATPVALNALTDTYSNSGTVYTSIGLTVSSSGFAANSRLLTLIVNSTEIFGVDPNGGLYSGDSNGFEFYKAGTKVAGLSTNFLDLDLSNAGAQIRWRSDHDLILTRAGAASLKLGDNDAASPVAQTLGVQSVVAGTSNTAGAAFTLKGSAGTGSGVGGIIDFQVAKVGTTGTSQNAYTSLFTVNPAVVVGNGGSGQNVSVDAGGQLIVPATSRTTSVFSIRANTNSSNDGLNFNPGGGFDIIGATNLYAQIDYRIQMSGNGWLSWGVNNFNYNNADTFITRGGVATTQLGKADVNGNAVAQTLSVQSAVTGTDKNAGHFTIKGSRPTGAGTAGNIIFQLAPSGSTGTTQGTLATVLTLTPTDCVVASTMGLQLGNAYAADTIAATGYVTVKDSTGTLYDILVRAH